MYDSGGLDVNV